MYYLTDKAGRIVALGDVEFEGAQLAQEEIVTGYDGRPVFKSETLTEKYKSEESAWTKILEIAELRHRREIECFEVVNRGAPWYSRLSDKQLAELNDWYQAWLDVTETLVVPDKPEWIK